jgi:hypothetical protein
MTQDVMLALLNRAATGNEMLTVLDSFVDTESADVEQVEYQNSPTLQPIEF